VRYYQGYIYASSDTTVYRWNYTNFRTKLGSPVVILAGMPAAGNHNTRTMEFAFPYMWVNIGSQNNIDTDSTRSKIVRTNITGIFPKQYGTDTIVYGDGTRNSVGLRLDDLGRLWAVENGIDNIGNGEARSDLGNVATYNPAEELNIYTDDTIGGFHGYPYCWSEGLTPDGRLTFADAQGAGTQWSTYNNSQFDDAWCRDTTNVIPPAYTFQAHHAPLDIIFLHNDTALITSHGTNRSILYLPLDPAGDPIVGWGEIQYLVHGPFFATWNVDPVAMVYAPCLAFGQCLYFTDDANGAIYVVGMKNSVANLQLSPTASFHPQTSFSDEQRDNSSGSNLLISVSILGSIVFALFT